jgi:hypothetical protein
MWVHILFWTMLSCCSYVQLKTAVNKDLYQLMSSNEQNALHITNRDNVCLTYLK